MSINNFVLSSVQSILNALCNVYVSLMSIESEDMDQPLVSHKCPEFMNLDFVL